MFDVTNTDQADKMVAEAERLLELLAARSAEGKPITDTVTLREVAARLFKAYTQGMDHGGKLAIEEAINVLGKRLDS